MWSAEQTARLDARRLVQVLRELGCDLGQGYFFSRPLASQALMAWCGEFEAAARGANDRAAE